MKENEPITAATSAEIPSVSSSNLGAGDAFLHNVASAEILNETAEMQEESEQARLVDEELTKEDISKKSAQLAGNVSGERKKYFTGDVERVKNNSPRLFFRAEEPARLKATGLAPYHERAKRVPFKRGDLSPRILTKLLENARVAASAFILGVASPVFAETPVEMLQTVEQSQTAGKSERMALPSYEQAKQQLVDGILTSPVEERAFFVHYHNAPSRTVLLKKGESVSVGLDENEYEQLKAAMASRVVTVEGVHTHPLSAVELTGNISHEEANRVRSGERPRFSFAPSSTDWMSIVGNDETYEYPPAQWSERVIDPAGEWEFGLSDSGAPFIRGLRMVLKEAGTIDTAPLSSEERAYLSKLLEDKKEAFFVVDELRKSSDPMAERIMATLVRHLGNMLFKNLPVEEMEKFNELSAPFSVDMTSEERDVRIGRMEKIAQELGFRVRYTPNPNVSQPASGHFPSTKSSSAQ